MWFKSNSFFSDLKIKCLIINGIDGPHNNQDTNIPWTSIHINIAIWTWVSLNHIDNARLTTIHAKPPFNTQPTTEQWSVCFQALNMVNMDNNIALLMVTARLCMCVYHSLCVCLTCIYALRLCVCDRSSVVRQMFPPRWPYILLA